MHFFYHNSLYYVLGAKHVSGTNFILLSLIISKANQSIINIRGWINENFIWDQNKQSSPIEWNKIKKNIYLIVKYIEYIFTKFHSNFVGTNINCTYISLQHEFFIKIRKIWGEFYMFLKYCILLKTKKNFTPTNLTNWLYITKKNSTSFHNFNVNLVIKR